MTHNVNDILNRLINDLIYKPPCRYILPKLLLACHPIIFKPSLFGIEHINMSLSQLFVIVEF